MRIIAVFLIALAVAPDLSYAGELKVIDDHGLTRAVRDIVGPARVIVRLNSKSGGVPADTQVRLSNTNGIAADISASSDGAGSFSFSDVPEGTWKLGKTSPDVAISEVRIQP